MCVTCVLNLKKLTNIPNELLSGSPVVRRQLFLLTSYLPLQNTRISSVVGFRFQSDTINHLCDVARQTEWI